MRKRQTGTNKIARALAAMTLGLCAAAHGADICIEIEPMSDEVEHRLFSHLFLGVSLSSSRAVPGFPGRYTQEVTSGLAISVNGDRTALLGSGEIDPYTRDFQFFLTGMTSSDEVAFSNSALDADFPRLADYGRAPFEEGAILLGNARQRDLDIEVMNRNGWEDVYPSRGERGNDYSRREGEAFPCGELQARLRAARDAVLQRM
jgi:hypothetical protein